MEKHSRAKLHLCSNPLTNVQFSLFPLFAGYSVKASIYTTIKSIEKRTCIQFRKTQLVVTNTSAAQNIFALFSNDEKRYVLYKLEEQFQQSKDNYCMCSVQSYTHRSVTAGIVTKVTHLQFAFLF